MRWSPEDLSTFFGSPVSQPDQPDAPHTIRFADDLISGQVWVRPNHNDVTVSVRRRGGGDLFEVSVPCRLIKSDNLSGGIPALFFFEVEAATMEQCRLYIARDHGAFAFYPMLPWQRDGRAQAEPGAPPNGGPATPLGDW
jgi:hypothetical protein